jgi:hypothetical protein
MPGVTKRKYVGETMRYNKAMKRPLYLIAEILPEVYNGNTLLEYFKKYYPVEWNYLVQMQKSYNEKDKFLVSVGKEVRYKPLKPENYFFSLPVVKNILSDSAKDSHRSLYNEEEHKAKLEAFARKRKSAIDKHNINLSHSTELLQRIDPIYIDVYINAYHKKGVTIEEKVEIVKDLSKYDSQMIDSFFYKLSDSERNNQVRRMAFNYLQHTGKYAKLRKGFKGKKKTYITETTDFDMTPEDLYVRLHSESIQIKKSFDIFISHSFSDQMKIITLFKLLNEQGYICYCDWTSDNDFLKRSMVSEYTKEVLKIRIEQSGCVLYARSDNAVKSPWIKFELEYAVSLKKTIVELNINEISTEDIPYEAIKLLSRFKKSYN